MDPALVQPIIFNIAAFLIGACIGSFINVCVYRIPLERSIVNPPSHCAACGAPIPWYNNIPIVSWLVLRGRATCCGTRIDARYCLVEAGMGVLFLCLWLRYGATDPIEALIYAFMLSGLAAACLIDLDHYIIPDRFSLGGCVAGFVACALHPALMGQKTALQGFSWSLASAILGAVILLGVATAGTLLFRKEAMGMGDVKLLAAMCAFLGTTSISWILPLSSLLGSVLGIGLIFWQRGAWGTRIPYGPFLGLAAVLWLFGGSDVMNYYWDHVGQSFHMSTAPMVPESVANPGR
jgi:leader peptidase (prepilin peptidase)/N-methyltransferase